MVKLFCLLLVGILSSTAAVAQDIIWRISSLTKGSYVTIKTTQNGDTEYYHHLYQGKSGGLHAVATLVGKTPDKTAAFVSYFDDMGNVKHVINDDGSKTRYKPHDCKRVAGTCRYTEIKSDGSTTEFTRVNSPTPGGFSFEIYDGGNNRVRQGALKIDDLGSAGDGWQKGADGTNVRYKLVATHYK